MRSCILLSVFWVAFCFADKSIEQWIGDLDDDSFDIRDSATDYLTSAVKEAKSDSSLVPKLKRALEEPWSAELRHRLKIILSKTPSYEWSNFSYKSFGEGLENSAAAFSPIQPWIAVLGATELILFDYVQQKVVLRTAHTDWRKSESDFIPKYVDFSADGKRLYLIGNDFHVARLSSSEGKWSIVIESSIDHSYDMGIDDRAGHFFLVDTERYALYDNEKKKITEKREHRSAQARTVQRTQEGNIFLVNSAEPYFRLLKLPTLEEVPTKELEEAMKQSHWVFALHPRGGQIVYTFGNTIRALRFPTAEKIAQTTDGLPHYGYQGEFSADGRWLTLLGMSSSGEAGLYDGHTLEAITAATTPLTDRVPCARWKMESPEHLLCIHNGSLSHLYLPPLFAEQVAKDQARDFDSLWRLLGGENAGKAHWAMRQLAWNGKDGLERLVDALEQNLALSDKRWKKAEATWPVIQYPLWKQALRGILVLKTLSTQTPKAKETLKRLKDGVTDVHLQQLFDW